MHIALVVNIQNQQDESYCRLTLESCYRYTLHMRVLRGIAIHSSGTVHIQGSTAFTLGRLDNLKFEGTLGAKVPRHDRPLAEGKHIFLGEYALGPCQKMKTNATR